MGMLWLLSGLLAQAQPAAKAGKTVTYRYVRLKDGSRLRSRYNRNRAWTEYCGADGTRFRLVELGSAHEVEELAPLLGRLGYSLIREYPQHLLFRSDCAANGPCEYQLISRKSGRVVRNLGSDLIAPTDDDATWPADCLVYLGGRGIELLWPTTGKHYTLIVPKCPMMTSPFGGAESVGSASLAAGLLRIGYVDQCGDYTHTFSLARFPAR